MTKPQDVNTVAKDKPKKIQMNVLVTVDTKNRLLSLIDGKDVCSLSDAVTWATHLATSLPIPFTSPHTVAD